MKLTPSQALALAHAINAIDEADHIIHNAESEGETGLVGAISETSDRLRLLLEEALGENHVYTHRN